MKNVRQVILTAVLVMGAGVCGFLLMHERGKPEEVGTGAGKTEKVVEVPPEDVPRDLGSGNPEMRRAAQAALARLPYQKRVWLRQEAESAATPEVKTALEKRLAEIEEMLATDPPPISLHVKEATLPEVVEALNQEMGTRLTYASRGDSPDGRYTLDVSGQPFWEVIAALDRQRPFRFDESYGVMSVADGRELNRESGMARHAIVGPFFMFAVPRYVERPTPARGGVAQERFEIACKVFVDPRMNVVDFGFGQEDTTLGPDTQGNVLRLTGGGGYVMHNAAVSGRIVSRQFIASPGTVVAWVKAEAEFTTGAMSKTVEIPEVEKAGAWRRELGAGWVHGEGFMPATMGQFSFQVGPPEVASLMTLYLMNGSGTPVWSLNGGLGQQGMLTGTITKPDPPYTLRIALAKTFKRKVTFEVKEIPLRKDF